MYNEILVLGLALPFWFLLWWGCKSLPDEGWQIFACIPVNKEGTDQWKSINLTYYGLFIALATVAAVSVILVLTAAIHILVKVTFLVTALTLLIGFSASRVVALMVEKSRHTFTIAGASFMGALALPGVLWGVDYLCNSGSSSIPLLPFLAAMSIAYTIGEGIGRLACISFGCCYGKPLSKCRPFIQRFFGRYAFVFSGKLKKIAYENGLEGERVVPIQAVTSFLYMTVGLISMLIFLKGHYSVALMLSAITTQVWRVFSETLRADYRGPGGFTAYQAMSIVTIAYVLIMVMTAGDTSYLVSDIATGLGCLWDPAVILFLQFIGLTAFIYTGTSTVTGSTIFFHIADDSLHK